MGKSNKVCEKNFVDGKVMSLSSKKENDDIIPSDWESVKKSKKKKRSQKEEFCKVCDEDIVENKKDDSLHKKNKYHVMLANDYCEDHEFKYNNTKCKVIWCEGCGFLHKYEITLTNRK